MKNLMKKISVFALLLSLMFALVAPVPAVAENTSELSYFDTTNNTIYYNGYSCYIGDNAAQYISDGYSVFCVKVGSYIWLYLFNESNFNLGCVDYTLSHYVFHLVSYNTLVTNGNLSQGVYFKYKINDDGTINYSTMKSSLRDKFILESSTGTSYKNSSGEDIYFLDTSGTEILYSSFDIYVCTQKSKVSTLTFDIFYSADVESVSNYLFSDWCSDAGLNCNFYTYDGSSSITYDFSNYYHIVNRTSKDQYGRWILTVIGNSVLDEHSGEYGLFISRDGNLHFTTIYGANDDAGYFLNVKQFIYDTDGWKLTSLNSYDTRNLGQDIDLFSSTGISDSCIIAYTSTDIYDFYYSLLYPKSTVYVDIPDLPDIPEEDPEEPEITDTPTPTPTTVPSGGDSGNNSPGVTPPDIGGEGTGGGGLDFIINLFTLIWTKICSISMAVDGYSISLQQIVIYGALVSIVGGFIMHFIFGRK